MNCKINDTIYRINLNKAQPSKYSLRETGLFIEKFKILGISETKICLNDENFTTFKILETGKKRDSWYSYLDNISVNIKTNETLFENGVFITLYSTKKPTKKTFQKMAATAAIEAKEKFGFLFGNVGDQLNEIINDYKPAK